MKTVKIVNKSNNPLPKFETEKAAGMDLRASFKYVTPETPLKVFGDTEIIFGDSTHKTLLRLEPGARAIIPTDMYITVPDNHLSKTFTILNPDSFKTLISYWKTHISSIISIQNSYTVN